MRLSRSAGDVRGAPIDHSADSPAAARPTLNGVSHAVSFASSCFLGFALVAAAPDAHRLAAAFFAISASIMLGTSALYHRVTWGLRRRLWMRRADHAAILLLIAGTYTPVALISLHGTWHTTVRAVAWSGALIVAFAKICWVRAPNWRSVVVAITLGGAGSRHCRNSRTTQAVAPRTSRGGGGAYTGGAVVYAFRRPAPLPHAFGYHELFPALTIVALTRQYVAIGVFVVGVS